MTRFCLVSLALLVACQPPVKTSNDAGGAGIGSISGINPPQVFLGNTTTVVIGGAGTHWDSTTKVDFGSDISVGSVVAGSVTALSVTLTVSESAALGPRTIIVTENAGTETLSNVFRVLPRVSGDAPASIPQGTVFLLHVKDGDASNPFGTADGNPIGNTGFAAFQIQTPPGVTAILETIDPLEANMLIEVDVTAPIGHATVQLLYPGTNGQTENAAIPLQIAARTAVSLSGNTPAMATLVAGPSSDLYQLQVPAMSVADITLHSGATSVLQYALLGAGGTFAADLVDTNIADSETTGATTVLYYLIVFDSTATGAAYDLSATVKPLASASNVIPGDSPQNAYSIATLPVVIQNQTLPSGGTNNYYSLTVMAADVGKAINVQVTDYPQTDTSIIVFGPDGVNPVPQGILSDTQTLTTAPITAQGTYYVDILAGSFWSLNNDVYDLVVSLQ